MGSSASALHARFARWCSLPGEPDASRLFLLLAALFGSVWIFLFPPFQGPDEYEHFFRASHIAEGHLRCERHQDGRIGGEIPAASFAVAHWMSEKHIEMLPERKFDCAWFPRMAEVGRTAQGAAFAEFPRTAAYTPVPYLPHVAGIRIARALGQDVLGEMYAVRMVNLVIWMGLTVWAIRLAGPFGWILAQCALLPGSISLAASMSADPLPLALTYLYLALILGSFFRDEAGARRAAVAAALLFPLLCLGKFFVVLGLVALVSPLIRRDGKLLAIQGAAFVVGCMVTLAWQGWVAGVQAPAVYWANPAEQARLLLREPVHFLAAAALSLFDARLLLADLIGVLGWMDVILSPWLYAIYWALLIVAAVVMCRVSRLNLIDRMWIVILMGVAIVAVYVRLYLTNTPPGSGRVIGVQGRYFLPVLPVSLLVLTHGLKDAWRERWGRGVAGVMLTANAGLLALASRSILARYYLP